MRALISLPLAGLFVFLAGFNAWIMVTSSVAHLRAAAGCGTKRSEFAGYIFIALYAGLGVSHQTGWTGLITKLMQRSGGRTTDGVVATASK